MKRRDQQEYKIMPTYEAGTEPTLLPEGVYPFTVLDAVDAISNAGRNPMIELTLLVRGPNGDEARVYDRLVFVKNMGWKIDHFRTATGETVVKGPASFDAVDALDRSGKCLLAIEDYQGREKNVVKDYIDPKSEKKPPSAKPSPAALPKPPEKSIAQEFREKGADDDDIPMK
jgi:hypothetical protein